jgi:hypothetical protein
MFQPSILVFIFKASIAGFRAKANCMSLRERKSEKQTGYGVVRGAEPQR